MAYSGIAWTRSRRVTPGCSVPLKRTSTDSGMSSGITPGGRGERDQAGAGRERNADREPRVRVAAGADGVRQQHAVEPAVDDAVARTQEMPPRVEMKSGNVWCVFTSTGFG
jgi:hypothetical protein